MKIWTVYFTYDEHEMESDIFCAPDDQLPTVAQAREMVISWHKDDYMQGIEDEPELLTIDGVSPDNATIVDMQGNPYKLVVQE